MTRLNVAQVKDLSNQGGMSFSGGAITANGSLTVNKLVINGTISGSSGYIIPSQSGQAGSFLYTNGSSISWSAVSGGGGAPNSISVYNSSSTWNKQVTSDVFGLNVLVVEEVVQVMVNLELQVHIQKLLLM